MLVRRFVVRVVLIVLWRSPLLLRVVCCDAFGLLCWCIVCCLGLTFGLFICADGCVCVCVCVLYDLY